MKKILMILGLILAGLFFIQYVEASSPVISPTCNVTGIITSSDLRILNGSSFSRQNNVTHLYINMSIESVIFSSGSIESGTCESYFPLQSEKSFFISDSRIYDDNNISVINLFEVGRRVIVIASTGSVGAFTVWNYSFGNLTCAQDVLMCEDGSSLQRNPAQNCSFPSCPTTDCKGEGEMCGGIAGLACCNGLGCELEGNYPDAAGTCVVLDPDICLDKCGDGVCQDLVCTGAGCPCVESYELCEADCAPIEQDSGESTSWSLFLIIGAVVLIFIGFKILKWVFWTLAIIAAILAILFWMI